MEGDSILYTRNEVPATEFLRTSQASFARPPVWNVEIPVTGTGRQHAGVLENFADAILTGAPLIAPAEEGIHSVELANTMLYSSLLGKPVDLPLDAAAYEAALKKLIEGSRFVKKTVETTETDMGASFN
mgnify:CR=1 FL=1